MINGKGSQGHEYPKQLVSTSTAYSQPAQHTKNMAVEAERNPLWITKCHQPSAKPSSTIISARDSFHQFPLSISLDNFNQTISIICLYVKKRSMQQGLGVWVWFSRPKSLLVHYLGLNNVQGYAPFLLNISGIFCQS